MGILDNDGNRIFSKYYDSVVFPTIKEQKAFEKNLFTKTHRFVQNSLFNIKYNIITLNFTIFQSERRNHYVRWPHMRLQNKRRSFLLRHRQFTWKWSNVSFVKFWNTSIYHIFLILVNTYVRVEWIVRIYQPNFEKGCRETSSIRQHRLRNVGRQWNLWRRVSFFICILPL